MRRLKLVLSIAFFTGYLAIQCALCLRSIASETRREYGFGMYTSKSLERRPYRVVYANGTLETFEMKRIREPRQLEFHSHDSDKVLSFPIAKQPEWSPELACRAHRADAVAIEWTEADEPRRFVCRD